MHLCKEYARSTATNTDNKRNIYERSTHRPFEIFVSASLPSLDSNRVARTSRVFKIGIERELAISVEACVSKNKYRTFKDYLTKNSSIARVSNKMNYHPARSTFKNCKLAGADGNDY